MATGHVVMRHCAVDGGLGRPGDRGERILYVANVGDECPIPEERWHERPALHGGMRRNGRGIVWRLKGIERGLRKRVENQILGVMRC
jgi:hypothetical protein